VSGIVVDANGNPIADVYVGAQTKLFGRRDSTLSEADGSFALPDFRPGSQVYVFARKDGLAMRPMEDATLSSTGVDGLRVVMLPEARISGTVVDAKGGPLCGASVKVVGQPGTHFDDKVQTDGLGHFTIGGRRPGTYFFEVGFEGSFYTRPTDTKPVTVREGDHVSGVIVRTQGGEDDALMISGRVTDTSGEPVPSAEVSAYGLGSSGYATTDEEGSYEVSGLFDGLYDVQVRPRSNHSSTEVSDVVAGSINTDVVLEPAGVIEGRVIRADNGSPVTDFQACHHEGARAYEPWMDYKLVHYQHPEGQFRIEGVQPGEATVIVRASGYAPTVEIVQGIPAGQTVSDITIRLESGAIIRGAVLNAAGQPLAGTEVYEGPVLEASERQRCRAVWSDANGAFTLDDLAVTTTQISAFHPDYAPASAPVTLQSGAVSEIEIVLLKGGTIEGAVTLAGKPMPNETVRAGTRWWDDDGPTWSSTTDANGCYSILGITPAKVRMSAYMARDARASGGRSRNIDAATIVEDGRATVVDFDFEPLDAGIEGYITHGGQFERVEIRAVLVDAVGGREEFEADVGSDGYYHIDVPAGILSLRARADNLRKTVTVRCESGTVTHRDIDFSSGGAIAGEVIGLPAGRQNAVLVIDSEDTIVELSPQLAAELEDQGAVVASVHVDDENDGAFRLDNIEPATYTVLALSYADGDNIEAMLADALWTTAVVSVSEDEETGLTLVLPSP